MRWPRANGPVLAVCLEHEVGSLTMRRYINISFDICCRNTEKRKEKSRDAARCRRGKEAEIFSDISAQLPMSSQTVEQLDKTSVMRLAISHLKLRTLFNTGW